MVEEVREKSSGCLEGKPFTLKNLIQVPSDTVRVFIFSASKHLPDKLIGVFQAYSKTDMSLVFFPYISFRFLNRWKPLAFEAIYTRVAKIRK